jgi:hypothetical protein
MQPGQMLPCRGFRDLELVCGGRDGAGGDLGAQDLELPSGRTPVHEGHAHATDANASATQAGSTIRGNGGFKSSRPERLTFRELETA